MSKRPADDVAGGARDKRVKPDHPLEEIKSGGIPLEWFVNDHMKDMHMICSICYKVFNTPTVTECGHTFCLPCHTAASAQAGGAQCPLCRSRKMKVDTASGTFLQRLVQDQTIRCPVELNAAEEAGSEHAVHCHWQGGLRDLAKHLDACELAVVACSKCAVEVQRGKLAQHSTEVCVRRLAPCALCEDLVPADEMGLHLTTSCKTLPYVCLWCHTVTTLRNCKSHEDECVEFMVSCPFDVAGCVASPMPRKDLAVHISQSERLHTRLMTEFKPTHRLLHAKCLTLENHLSGIRTVLDDDAMYKAAESNAVTGIQALAYMGIGVNAGGSGYHVKTPLHVAVEHGHMAAAECLLEMKAEVATPNTMGSTALHYAVQSGSIPMVELVLKHGGFTTRANNAGHTPVGRAQANGRADLVRLLQQAGGGRPIPVPTVVDPADSDEDE